ncbi:MAG TPA: antitoxin AF2212-like protein [Candidatus Wunengus sp. YC60]|uniref:antitoxin AF2212-like protein n=1 Tax=Candidatus Wunengus sp. YC60 TaxID=3367697 RepID=UPI004025F327
MRAKIFKRVIKPLEKVDVEDGKEVFVTIIEVPTSPKEDAFERSASYKTFS